MADWYAIYQTSDGTLVSLATVVADPLPAGLTKKLTTAPPRDGLQWNTTLLDWEPRPAPPPDVDRIDEWLGRVGVALVGPTKTAIQGELAVMLGERRFRDPSETYEIGER